MEKNYHHDHHAEEVRRYLGAAALLPNRLRAAALNLPEELQAAAEELRVRAGQPMTVLLPDDEMDLNITAGPEELEILCDLATGFSRYAAAETIREGFLSVRGGYRVGLCGTAVMKDGENRNLKDLSSAVIRISRERKGVAEAVIPNLFQNGDFQNTLILSPPGAGKTTLLRDIIRILSYGAAGYKPMRIALIDERGEIAASVSGRPQMDVGPRTDILNACPKSIGIPVLLRAMNPQVIAVDEITSREDIKSMLTASGCGVKLLATIHAGSVRELREKPLYHDLLSERVFESAIRIVRTPRGREYQTEPLSQFQSQTQAQSKLNPPETRQIPMLPDA